MNFDRLTLKKDIVLPPITEPYLILFCAAKSSALFIEEPMRDMVKKAAKFAV